MASRLELQTKLEEFLGSRNVYFQPPESVKLQYPCIIYALNRIETLGANDKVYLMHRSYSVTIIDKNPDSVLPERLLETFECCSMDTHYKIDNLNHYIFTLFY